MIAPSSDPATSAQFEYDVAFSRNLGIVSPSEQQRLRQATALVVGCGGVGGSHAVSLARLGFGHFRLIDPDVFDWANFNRQIGATVDTVGKPKAETIADAVRCINPEATVTVTSARLDADNVRQLVSGCDVVLDGLDFFAIEARRTLYREARKQKVTVITVGPTGMAAAAIVFTPTSMSFDRYFDLHDQMSREDMLLNFFVALAPAATQRAYVDMSYTNLEKEYGSSLGPTCLMCSGIAGIEALRVVLARPGQRPAPYSLQFDAYRHLLVERKLRWGNRGPLQRIKRAVARRMLARHFPQLRSPSRPKL